MIAHWLRARSIKKASSATSKPFSAEPGQAAASPDLNPLLGRDVSEREEDDLANVSSSDNDSDDSDANDVFNLSARESCSLPETYLLSHDWRWQQACVSVAELRDNVMIPMDEQGNHCNAMTSTLAARYLSGTVL